jgi:ribosome biogenesis SPOUT family RNA methylase Rps3
MNTQERDQLLAEKTVIGRMLASLPESSVIDRMSLEARKAKVEEALRSEDRLRHDNIHEEDQRVSGQFLGVLPHRRTFEFQVTDMQNIISGKVGPAVEDAGSINHTLGQPLIIQVRTRRAGTGRPKYTLLGYEQPETT